jgi:hypothetical protein
MTNEHRVQALLEALGLDADSFWRFLEWALCEHLVSALGTAKEIGPDFFSRVDALREFRDLLGAKTRRTWSRHDLDLFFDRVKMQKIKQYRSPVRYEEYLKLLWQVPWECAKCHRRPPDVTLHVDHVIPASRGGSSKRINLQFLCSEDNLRKSNQREVTKSWLDLR